MKDMGLYVVEDLHTSYWQEFGGESEAPKDTLKNATSNMMTFLKYISDKSTSRWASRSCRAYGSDDLYDITSRPYDYETGSFLYLWKGELLEMDLDVWDYEVDSVHFHDSICFVYKKVVSAKEMQDKIANYRNFTSYDGVSTNYEPPSGSLIIKRPKKLLKLGEQKYVLQ